MTVFTPEELEELKAYDAEVDALPLTMDEIIESRNRDREAIYASKDVRGKKKSKYRRSYYLANKERFRAYRQKYRDAGKENRTEYMAAYYSANKETISQRKKNYREANRDRINEKKRAHYAENREAMRAYQREWHARKKGKHDGDQSASGRGGADN